MKIKMYKLRAALIITLANLLISSSIFAQSPQKMSYQAVIRNAGNNLVTSRAVGMKVSILQGSASGTAVYVETQTPTTNVNGLVSIEIGSGTVVSGNFATINWANGPYFIKTETDPTGGTNYTITGTSQLLSVPYALHAKTAETVTGSITETDPVFTAWDKSTGISITESQISDLKSYLTTEVDGSVSNEIQNLSYTASTRVLAIDGTGSTDVTLPEATTTNAGLMSATDKTKLNAATTGTTVGQMQYWSGTAWVNLPVGNDGQVLTLIAGVPRWTTVAGSNDVRNPTTGKIWMDRNLGATQVATSSTDAASYGDLYQWGRAADGHQIRTSGTTTTLATSNTPGHGSFILAPNSPFDWRNPQNPNLWQGVNGTNNPCPIGYRLPTEAEWNAERASWSSNNAAGAFASPLKLPVAGSRINSNGTLHSVGGYGSYWSSTVDGSLARFLLFNGSNARMSSNYRAFGFSVRCLKD